MLDHFGFRSLCDYRKAEVAEPIIRAIALRSFANEVESGGIHQYLSCHTFDEAVYARESLETIGERRLAELLAYAIPLTSDHPTLFADESWKQATELTRNAEFHDIEADFREAIDQVESSFYTSYARFIKANLDPFTEFDDNQKCQDTRERFPVETNPEDDEAVQRALQMHLKFVAWHTTKRSLLCSLAVVGIIFSIVAFVFGFGLGCVTSFASALIVLPLYLSWRPKI
ncbi:MAG: DUF4375 domain-containing protein [Planctomycetaceae bacterium]|nr:DUF4375 domain-containing protein [Planctomycetaceae bacterium]MBT6485022.1 DUF4375 domain-containing protein [Planctomycetaceae bacterium]